MTTISRYVNEWKRNNRITGVSLKTKRSVTRAPGVAKKRYTVTPKLLAVNSDDIGGGDLPPSDVDVRSQGVSNVIEFPYQGYDNMPKNKTARMSPGRGVLDVPQVPSQRLGDMWRECLSATFSPENMAHALSWTFKVLIVLALIAGALCLSVHISGEFFGNKGFETALGVLLGGGILSFLARTSQNVWKAASFRFLAYMGTLGFLLVAYSGIKDVSIKESESYILAQKSIASLEAKIDAVSHNISLLLPEYGKLRDREYARQDQLKKELDVERQKLSLVAPNANADLSVIGNFIARFILDVLVFALFEVLAGWFVMRRKECAHHS
jgi:hypothetical protein